MKKRMIPELTLCMIALILSAGCGKTEDNAGNRGLNVQNSVQSVLEQGISEADKAEGPENPEATDARSSQPTASDDTGSLTSAEGETVDLTSLSSTMVYAEVYNMMTDPDSYIGRKVKMSGSYAVYHDESTDRLYHACIISDATACCSQGIEFELTEDYSYPEDYPEEGGQICVEGVFDTYKEGENTYCTLRNSVIQN